MPDFEPLHQESDFIAEKIKERPLNKKKLLRTSVITALSGVLFAVIASVTFLILIPLLSKRLNPEELPTIVEFPEEIDYEEIAPENMLVEEEPPVVSEPEDIDDAHIEEVVMNMDWSLNDFRSMNDSVYRYAKDCQRSLVTVTGAISNTDWFNETYESKGATSGLIFYDNTVDLLILVDRTNLSKAQTLSVTFYDGTKLEAFEKAYDPETNLSVIAVPLNTISQDLRERISIASLGSSNTVSGLSGTMVVALGSPMGTEKSVCFGHITSDSGVISLADANYRLLTTDIYASTKGSGVLMDTKGQVLGFLSNKQSPSDTPNLLTALGISELKKVITKLGNGGNVPYFGIVGTDVSDEVNETLGVPKGAFIKEIYMDSPAMLAGIQRGDVIVKMGGSEIDRFSTYTNFVMGIHEGDTVKITIMRQAQDEYKE